MELGTQIAGVCLAGTFGIIRGPGKQRTNPPNIALPFRRAAQMNAARRSIANRKRSGGSTPTLNWMPDGDDDPWHSGRGHTLMRSRRARSHTDFQLIAGL